jgi:hypothetical protein
LAIGREVALSPLRADDDDLALAYPGKGYFAIAEFTAEVKIVARVEITSHIPKVPPKSSQDVDEVENLKYVLRLVMHCYRSA